MNKNDYINKMNKIISNKAQFQKVSVDDNIANLSKFQRFLYNLKRKQFLKKEVYDRIRPISALTPTLCFAKTAQRRIPMSAYLSIKW